MRITRIEFDRKPGLTQTKKLAEGWKPLAFMNVAGAPTLYVLEPPGAVRDTDASFMLATAGSDVPDDAKHLGSAEFSGGQVSFHAFIVN